MANNLNMRMARVNEDFQTLDIYLTSYLSLKGLNPEIVLINGKAIFCFKWSEELVTLVNEFNANANVPVNSYATEVKKIRSQMLNMKNELIKKAGQ